MARLAVLLNPRARLGRSMRAAEACVQTLAEHDHDVLQIRADNAEEALSLLKSELNGIDAVIAAGGDGTAHVGVNAVAGTQVPLGIIPLGTGNDLARSLGIDPHKPAAGVQRVLTSLGRQAMKLDAIAIDRIGSAQTCWSACVVSAGLDAAVNERANSYAWPRGSGRYLRAVATEIAHFSPYGYRLTIDGELREQDATLVAIANAPYFGGGMEIAPGAEMDDGELEVIIGHAMNRRNVTNLFPKLYRGTHLRSSRVEAMRAHSVLLEASGTGKMPPVAYADGERIGELPLKLSVVPGALKLL